MTTLRYYQTAAIRDIPEASKDGVIYCAPTATGKTVVAASFINLLVTQDRRVLVICHRAEILEQTSKNAY